MVVGYHTFFSTMRKRYSLSLLRKYLPSAHQAPPTITRNKCCSSVFIPSSFILFQIFYIFLQCSRRPKKQEKTTTLSLEVGFMQLHLHRWFGSTHSPLQKSSGKTSFSSLFPSTAVLRCRALCFWQDQAWQPFSPSWNEQSSIIQKQHKACQGPWHLHLSTTQSDIYLGPSQGHVLRSQNLRCVLILPNSSVSNHSTPVIPQRVPPAIGMHDFVICNC